MNTHLSRGRTSASEKSKYKYFNVSAVKKLSILLRCVGDSVSTLSSAAYPPPSTYMDIYIHIKIIVSSTQIHKELQGLHASEGRVRGMN